MERNGAKAQTACVMGDANLLRPLAMVGLRPTVVTQRTSGVRFSRFAGGVIDADSPRLLEDLIEFGRAQPSPPVLFFQSDEDLELVAKHRERLAEAFRFVLPEPELAADLLDKERFSLLARRLDLPVPASRRVRPSDETGAPDLGLRFPVVLKPVPHRTPGWDRLSPGKALRAETSAVLERGWEALRHAGGEFLVQELVEGPETRLESYHVYVDDRGEIAGEFTGRKIRTLPAEFGHSTAVVTTDTEDVARLGREVVRRMGFSGVAKLDFKRAPDGSLHLLEINPRFSLWAYPGALAGVNLPALVHADLTGRPRPAASRGRPGIRWCALREDLTAAREAGVPARTWLRWVLSVEAKSGIDWDDPMPIVRRKLTPAAARLLRRGRGS